MNLRTVSNDAYQLLQQWKFENKKFFSKIRKDQEALLVINALAEMLVQLKSSSPNKNLVHF